MHKVSKIKYVEKHKKGVLENHFFKLYIYSVYKQIFECLIVMLIKMKIIGNSHITPLISKIIASFHANYIVEQYTAW